jgi:small subunit ribosomal protein S20
LANIKSAQKRILVTERNRQRNTAIKSSIKTAVKRVFESVSTEDKAVIQEKLNKVYSLYDKAAGKGVLHKNNAARKKSRLTKNVNKKLEAPAK